MSAQRFTPEFKEDAVKAVSPARSEPQSQELLKAKSEILRLRSQMRRIEEERDILKKAERYLVRVPE